jgi:3-hydroxyacyl-[acyl-carrier-protein] dehydratase
MTPDHIQGVPIVKDSRRCVFSSILFPCLGWVLAESPQFPRLRALNACLRHDCVFFKTSLRTPFMKFCLVDRINSLVPGESIQTIKNVSLAEEYLQDHFPGFAVLPGVMMVECLVQSCAWLSRVSDDFRYSTLLLKQARAVKFNSFLKPGQTLEVTATLRSSDDSTAEFMASGTVNGQSAVSARLILSKQNLAERNPKLSDNDQRLIASMKDLFEQIRVL